MADAEVPSLPATYDDLPPTLKRAVDAMVQYTAATSALTFPRLDADLDQDTRIKLLLTAIGTFESQYREGVMDIIKIIDQDHLDMRPHWKAVSGRSDSVLFFSPFPCALVAPLNRNNGHNFPIESPFLLMACDNGAYGIRPDGRRGTTTPPSVKADYRAPTAAEARAFFTSIFAPAARLGGLSGAEARIEEYLREAPAASDEAAAA